MKHKILATKEVTPDAKGVSKAAKGKPETPQMTKPMPMKKGKKAHR